jgi:hypothetical protein
MDSSAEKSRSIKGPKNQFNGVLGGNNGFKVSLK